MDARVTKVTQSRRNRTWKRMLKQRYLYLLLLPGIILLAVFHYAPLYGVVIAFKKYNPIRGVFGSPWLDPWFSNFTKLFGNVLFERVLTNTIVLNLYSIAVAFPAPILLALMLNELNAKRFKSLAQTLTYMPHFLSWVIVGTFVTEVLSPYTGVMSLLARLFGFEYSKALLASPAHFKTIAVFSGMWKEIGWASIVYLAAITSINPDYYDAARIDGAGRLKQTLHVTLPSIVPTIIALFVLRLGGILGANFEQIFVLMNASNQPAADVIATFVYREGLQKGNYSYTAAVGLFQSVVGFFFIIGANTISKRFDNQMW